MSNPANLYAQPAASMEGTATIDKQKQTEGKAMSDPLVKKYIKEMKRYDSVSADWQREGEDIVKLYMAESANKSSARKFPLLYANIETLKPNVYTKVPTVLCARRYKDRDPTARTAAELIQRATNTTFELYNADEVFRMVRDDRLLPGRGTAWVRYEAEIEQYENTTSVYDPATDQHIDQTISGERLKSENACIDYVYWQDFGHNVARTWAEVWLVWRCVYKTRDEVADRFGDDVASRLSYTSKAPVGDGSDYGSSEAADDYCKIYEFWDKRSNLVSWLAEDENNFLESGAPPIKFCGFFPCPEPCYATKTSKGLIPRADYVYYRDQAKEINDLTDKIHRLTQWLIVKGFVPGGPSTTADPLEEVMRDKGNQELFVQVESFTEWTEKGGAGKLIDWLPIQNVVAALQAAIQARSQLIQDVYQLTGIGDILRGQTDPNETFGAVDLRNQTGSRRLRNTKEAISIFCRDIGHLVAEVIAQQFSPQTIAEITGYTYKPPLPPMLPNMTNVAMFPGAQMPMGGAGMPGTMPMGAGGMAGMMQPQRGMGDNGGPPLNDGDPELSFDDSVIQLLRDDKMRSFRIDIETDSTVQADENAEKAQRTEFLGVVGDYLEKAAGVVDKAPAMAETAGEILMFAVRTYRPGRTLEETIERGFANLVKQKQAQMQQPMAEDPLIDVAKIQAASLAQKTQSDAAVQTQKQQIEAQTEIRKQNLDAAVKIRQQDIQAAARPKDVATRMAYRIQNANLAPMALPATHQTALQPAPMRGAV